MAPTVWTRPSIVSTDWSQNVTDIVYDESGTTYDTLAYFYDGNKPQQAPSTNWTPVAPTA